MIVRRRVGVAISAVALLGCSPTLDWRDVRPDGAGLRALFPCKPGSHEREVREAGQSLRMSMYACEAGGATFALGFADTGSAAMAASTLAHWKSAAQRNVQGELREDKPIEMVGVDPSARAARVSLRGRAPGGDAVDVELLLFSRQGMVYQATVFGRRLEPEALDTFFSALKFDA